ncbi:MAG: hypothetical protein ACKOTA_08220, partial [Solirubrobacterales bacterium]
AFSQNGLTDDRVPLNRRGIAGTELGVALLVLVVVLAHAQAGVDVAAGPDADGGPGSEDGDRVTPVARTHAAGRGQAPRVVPGRLGVGVGQVVPGLGDRAAEAPLGGGQHCGGGDRHEGDADQYSDCRAILRAAQLAAASGVKTLTPAAAAEILASATPEEQAAIEEAVNSSDGAPVQVGDDVVSPASYGAGREVAAGISDLPTPLKAALGLLAVGALAALLTAIVPRVRDRLSR